MCCRQKFALWGLVFYFFCLILELEAGAETTGKIGILSTGSQPGHYLQWKGRPLLLIGDSVTQGWMECGSNFDQAKYVKALASRGINILMIWSYIATNAKQQQNDSRIGYDAPEFWPWIGSPDRGNFELTKFNKTYFDRLKALVAHAESKGIIVLITVHDGWPKRRFSIHPFNTVLGNGPLRNKMKYVQLADYNSEMPVNFNRKWRRKQKNQYFQERFCDKLISVLNPYSNVIYEIFNEGEWYNHRYRNLHEQHFLAFFKARCNNLLITNTDHIIGDDPHKDHKVDVISLHGGWFGRFDDFQKGFNKIPVKPYLLSEPVPAYNGNGKLLDSLRQMAWEVVLAGGGWVCQNDLSFGWDPNTRASAKKTSMEKLYDYVGYCARFFNNSGINFWGMKPKGDLSSTRICMAKEGVEYVVYAPKGGKFTVNLSGADGSLIVKWYNPRSGKFWGPDIITGGKISLFSAPDYNDWIVYIKVKHSDH